MRTITLKLPDELVARVTTAAHRRGMSTSALVRETLEQRLERESPERAGSCLDLAGDLRGVLLGPIDLASNPSRLRGYGSRRP